MHFLADESCDFAVVRALRGEGHDVLAVVEAAPRSQDDVVLELARQIKRILLTEDKDFGQWVYADKRATGGVILLRYPPSARQAICVQVVSLVAREGEALLGCFVVVQPGRIRINRPDKR